MSNKWRGLGLNFILKEDFVDIKEHLGMIWNGSTNKIEEVVEVKELYVWIHKSRHPKVEEAAKEVKRTIKRRGGMPYSEFVQKMAEKTGLRPKQLAAMLVFKKPDDEKAVIAFRKEQNLSEGTCTIVA